MAFGIEKLQVSIVPARTKGSKRTCGGIFPASIPSNNTHREGERDDAVTAIIGRLKQPHDFARFIRPSQSGKVQPWLREEQETNTPLRVPRRLLYYCIYVDPKISRLVYLWANQRPILQQYVSNLLLLSCKLRCRALSFARGRQAGRQPSCFFYSRSALALATTTSR